MSKGTKSAGNGKSSVAGIDNGPLQADVVGIQEHWI